MKKYSYLTFTMRNKSFSLHVYLALTFTGTAFSVKASLPNPFGQNVMASATIVLNSVQASLSFKVKMNEKTL